MRKIDKIIVHCSATAAGKDFGASDIDRWHRARGFNSIGYHYVVRLDGRVERGRDESEVGAHCKGQNAHSIGVCYIGGLRADGRTPCDTRTAAQRRALRELIAGLRRRYPGATVHGHREYAAKACPCFDAAREYATALLAGVVILSLLLAGCSASRSTKQVNEQARVEKVAVGRIGYVVADTLAGEAGMEADSVVIGVSYGPEDAGALPQRMNVRVYGPRSVVRERRVRQEAVAAEQESTSVEQAVATRQERRERRTLPAAWFWAGVVCVAAAGLWWWRRSVRTR